MTIKYDKLTDTFSYEKTFIEGPVFAIVMPLNAWGHGPEENPDLVRIVTWEVWDQVLNVVCKCNCEEDAKFIADLINKENNG